MLSLFPLLRRLRLENATVGWTDPRYYGRLDEFILFKIGVELALSPLRLYTILRLAGTLLRMCLYRVSCEGPLDASLPPIHLPRLHTLHLRLEGSIGVVRVLSTCRMPALSSLTLFLPSGTELLLFLQCAPAMASITSLAIDGSSGDLPCISRMYSHFPLLLILDLSRATPSFCDALYDPLREDPHMCPKLQELRVINMPLQPLRRLLEMRSSASRTISRLSVSRVFDVIESDDEMDWFYDAYSEEDLLVDPEPSFGRLWWEDY